MDNTCGDGAHGIDRLHHFLPAKENIIEQAFKLRGHPGVDQRRIGSFQNAEERQAPFGGDDIPATDCQELLRLQPTDNLRPRRRGADPLGFLQSLPQCRVFHKTPGVLHRLYQRALVISRRRLGFFVFNHRGLQECCLAIAQRGQKHSVLPFFFRWLPVGERRPPAKFNGLPPGGPEGVAPHVQNGGGLPITEVRHHRRQIRARDNIEQPAFVGGEVRPH